ncbi:MAG TPA: Hsp20/alpha crystallin family protein [Burkholderiaceae bacterium]|mgnify:CR=1 FL=1|jgi:HSP20 family protein|nr:Hsp20/alpha crystallin family protein [Burkholderiaceae bacterium]
MTRMSVYDPFAEVFPELFRGILSPSRGNAPQPLDIRIDVKENAGEYVVQAELPGVARDDIHVQVDGNRVSISAEVKRESEQKEGDRVLRSERYYGNLARSFSLANDIDDDNAAARFENGVLSLTLPKKTAPGARKLQIS